MATTPTQYCTMHHPLTLPILRILADGQFHSGVALAKYFNTQPSQIRNALQAALALDVEVLAVRGRGYCLLRKVDFLEINAVLAIIGKLNLILEIHDCLASTNSYLMQNAFHYPHPSCIASQLQTQGRGRGGRSWQSGLGTSLTFSLLWRFACGAKALVGLSLVVGVALIRALRSLGVNAAMLKWPNDVLVHGAKLAGVLIELQGGMASVCTAIIGIGINLNLHPAVQQRIDQPATDINQYLSICSSTLLGTLLKALVLVLVEFEQRGFPALREEWIGYHAYHQQAIVLHSADGNTLSGRVIGVAKDGALLVMSANGEQRFLAGDIQLRKVCHEVTRY